MRAWMLIKSIRFLHWVQNFFKFYTNFRLMISWLYCVLLLQKLLIFTGKKKKKDWNVETVVLSFCGDRKDAPACRFILMWHIIAQKLFLKLGWKKSQEWHTEAVVWQTCLGCMQGKLRGVGTMLQLLRQEERGEQSIACPFHSAHVSD